MSELLDDRALARGAPGWLYQIVEEESVHEDAAEDAAHELGSDSKYRAAKDYSINSYSRVPAEKIYGSKVSNPYLRK